MEDKVLMFELSPKQLKFRDIMNKKFIELEIWAISDINPNRNKTHFTKESLEKILPHVKDTPILGFFENGDFTEHVGKVAYDEELDKAYWDTEKGERILGWVRESDPVELVESEGLTWLKFRCILCTAYGYRQVRRLLKDKNKKVSVEIVVVKSQNVEQNGEIIQQIDEFDLRGVTILGTKNGKPVLEGIPNAHLSVLENLDDLVLEKQRKVLNFAYKEFDGANSDNFANNNLGEANQKKEGNQANMEDNKILLDKSKEAMSTTPWGSVDKAELRRKVVEAENFKDIAHNIFLDLREGWEDGEVTKLKYPVMEIKDNTAVYNRGGLAAAKAYAEQHEDKEVLEKVSKIYEELELEDSDEEKESAQAYCGEFCDDYCDIQPQQQNQTDPEPTGGEGNGEGEGHGDGDKHPDDCECDACKMAKLQAAYEACQVELESTKAEIDALLKEKEELNEKCLKSDEQVKTLEEKCTSLEDALKEKDVFAAECQHKCEEYEAKLNECSNYAEIKSQLDEANAKLHTYHCKELEMSAIELMKDESINDTYSKQILDKCKEGLYASVEDIQVDIAVGIYKSRANRKNTYSTNINSTNTQTIKWDEMTREERIKARNAK